MNNTKSEVEQLILTLLTKGYSKWRIAKEMNVSWQTIYCWQRGAFTPSPDKLERLKGISEAA